MIKRKLKPCKGCGLDKMIWARGMCQECDRAENPPKALKQSQKPLKRAAIKYKKEATGEGEFFRKIWEKRPHKCQCCGEQLGDVALAHFFSHLLGKQAYPSLRLEELNIMLMCWNMNGPSCHTEWDTGDKSQEKFKLARLITEKLKARYYGAGK